MKTIFQTLVFLLIFSSNQTKDNVDLLVLNATIYTVEDGAEKVEAMAVNDGKIVDIGQSEALRTRYEADQTIDAEGTFIFPGFIDAHCHFYGLGLSMQTADLTGTQSFEEVIDRIVNFQKKHNYAYILGRGWDQNDWEVKEFPTKDKLDSIFPNTPVAIQRIDGHALLANQAAIDLANVTVETAYSGGEILQKDGKLTGIFIDAPMAFIQPPAPSREMSIKALIDAQKVCFDLGLTTVDDAGLSIETIELIDSLQQAGILKMKIYAMVSGSKRNLNYFLKKGIIKSDRLNVRSFKYYGDGALGSRGAALRKSYSDHPNHFGAMVTPLKELKEAAKKIANSDFQMNTHAIGDSANHFILQTYKKALKNKKNRRWRIEHAQIISPTDFAYFENIIPSIQPTHATSDMYWAQDRLGSERIKGAYAYKKLLNQYGKVALGTDFPVEKVNPMLTFYAAVARKDLSNYPEGGFQIENRLSREETLKGMTLWAAYANFEEDEKGSIKKGKYADFIILDQNIMEIPIADIPKTKVLATFVQGEKVN
ncbi:amidohydrolase [Flavobacteriaceae bacterium F08102]|nr:amidohydrolase [Flavobacteriaceae bacterium F08102]